jgi:hypothetical protein
MIFLEQCRGAGRWGGEEGRGVNSPSYLIRFVLGFCKQSKFAYDLATALFAYQFGRVLSKVFISHNGDFLCDCISPSTVAKKISQAFGGIADDRDDGEEKKTSRSAASGALDRG